MGIFNKKPNVGPVVAQAPVEQETPGELAYTKDMAEPTQEVSVKKPQPVAEQPEVKEEAVVPSQVEVPICMSQTQINNMIIGLDIKLNYIISKLEE